MVLDGGGVRLRWDLRRSHPCVGCVTSLGRDRSCGRGRTAGRLGGQLESSAPASRQARCSRWLRAFRSGLRRKTSGVELKVTAPFLCSRPRCLRATGRRTLCSTGRPPGLSPGAAAGSGLTGTGRPSPGSALPRASSALEERGGCRAGALHTAAPGRSGFGGPWP